MIGETAVPIHGEAAALVRSSAVQNGKYGIVSPSRHPGVSLLPVPVPVTAILFMEVGVALPQLLLLCCSRAFHSKAILFARYVQACCSVI